MRHLTAPLFLLALIALLLQPIHSRPVCLAVVIIALLLAWRLVVLLPRPGLRWAAAVLLALPVIPVLLPARPDPADLQAAYVRCLRGYIGTPYLWGGEGCYGIDCSGLPRRALRDACLARGYARLDGGALRRALDLWWNDASAKELLAGYGGRTETVGGPYVLNDLNDLNAAALPGDLAVTANGVHVMVHAHGRRVIQADPGRGLVVEDVLPDGDPWYGQDVRLVRWRW